MYRSVSSNLNSFKSLSLFCAIVLIETQFTVAIRPTDESYNNFILTPRRAYDDVPSSSSSIIEQCTSGLPCPVLTDSIRTMRALLNELEITSKQHCQRSHGSEMKSFMKPSRQINDHLQRPRIQASPLRSASKIQHFGQSVRRLQQNERSHFSPRQLLRELPLEPYQRLAPHREPYSFDPTGQAYTINPRQIRNLNQSLQLPVVPKFEVEKSETHDQLSSSDTFGSDGRRTKMKRRKPCSRRSGTGKKRMKSKLRIEEDSISEESEDESNDMSEEVTSPKNETEPVSTSSSESEGVDSKTDRPDET